MNINEIKPCPFCGGKAIIKVFDNCDLYYVQCVACRVQTRGYKTDFQALNMWNIRTDKK